MDSFEKLDRAIALQPTPEIPVYPHIVTFAGRCAGITQQELFSSNQAWLDAYTKTLARVGKPDVVFPLNPHDTAYIESMRVKLPGKELGPDEPFQFVEDEFMLASDYDMILDKGWTAWNTEFMKRIQNPPLSGPLAKYKVLWGFIKAGMNTGKNIKYWREQGMPVMFHTGVAPPFDVFSLSRSLRPFYRDLFDNADKVKKAVEVGTDAMIKMGIANAKRAKGDRVALFAMRSSASFISPKIFDDISFPSLKRMVEGYHAAGLTSVLHCDGNWDLMIPRFLELPRASCVVELDGATNIRKAREVLKDHLCIKGDVHHALLALAPPEEVTKYCGELIEFMGHDGGFILGSGCEVPITAKVENVAAMIASVRL
jgi:Uroporphyrinogen decarboxylase (URO-D)